MHKIIWKNATYNHLWSKNALIKLVRLGHPRGDKFKQRREVNVNTRHRERVFQPKGKAVSQC